jgi:uncharacterized protein (DUF1015 family)
VVRPEPARCAGRRRRPGRSPRRQHSDAHILTPILGIVDPRTDARIDFVGGGRGLADLARRVDEDGWAVAFSLYPTALADLMAVADAGLVMPPKSTWFEPKLADGLLSLPITG